MATFKPSEKSAEQTLTALRYIKQASTVLEQHVLKKGDPPDWVVANIHQAKLQLGMGISYLQSQKPTRKVK
jgi:hypothetical protein